MSTKIETLELEIVANSTGAKNGIDALTSSLTKLKNATKGSFGLSNVTAELRNLNKAANESPKGNKKVASSFTDLFHKVKVGVGVFKNLGNSIWSAIGKSSDYTETLHLFNVAMGKTEYSFNGVSVSAQEYAEIISDIMGIDTEEWMKAQGVFMTLATGFGVASDRASVMSKNLTQLSYDLSSFYNMDVEDAFLKLKSGLAGELEPLRAIGYDLSQAKLEAIALELGLDKAVSSMTQAEKAQLRYYAIMTQVTQTHGDMAKTLDQPANQLRVLKAEFNMAAREIGNLFIPALNAILPIAIAATRVIGALANAIAGLFGNKKEGLSETTSNVASNTDAMTTNLEDATKEAKKLKSYMLGIDELNVINPNANGEEDSSDLLDFPLPEYDFLEGLVETKVDGIVQKMKEWLGITDDIDSWAEDFNDTRLGDIVESVGVIGAGILAWEVSSAFKSTISALATILSSPSHMVTIGVTLAILGITMSLNGIKDSIKNGLDAFNFAEILGGSLLTAAGAAALGALLAVWLDTAFATSKITLAITAFGIKIGVGTYKAAGAALGGAITAIISGVGMIFAGIKSSITEGISVLSGVLTAGGATLVGAGIGVFFGPVGAAVGALIGLAVGLITDLVIWIVQNWDAISKFLSNLWDNISALWGKASQWFNDTVIKPIADFFKPLSTLISEVFSGAWIIIQAVWKVASTWIKDTFITPVVDDFIYCKEHIISELAEAWDSVTEKWKKFSTWVKDNLITPVVDDFIYCKDQITTAFSSMWTSIRVGAANAMNDLIGVIEGLINRVIRGINDLMDGFNDVVKWGAEIIGADWDGITILKEVSLPRITVPQYANGGFPEQGQMFIANEAGAEMVGNIGRRTAVANNEQIVESISGGVASANEEQNALLREQNSLLRSILEKDSGVYLDGKNLANSVEKYQRERGRVLIAGGVI